MKYLLFLLLVPVVGIGQLYDAHNAVVLPKDSLPEYGTISALPTPSAAILEGIKSLPSGSAELPCKCPYCIDPGFSPNFNPHTVPQASYEGEGKIYSSKNLPVTSLEYKLLSGSVEFNTDDTAPKKRYNLMDSVLNSTETFLPLKSVLTVGPNALWDGTIYGGTYTPNKTLQYISPTSSIEFKPADYIHVDTTVLFNGIDTVHSHDWADSEDGIGGFRTAMGRFHPYPDREVICTICLKNLLIKERVITRFNDAKARLNKMNEHLGGLYFDAMPALPSIRLTPRLNSNYLPL